MKRLLPFLLIAPLATACRQSPTSAPAVSAEHTAEVPAASAAGPASPVQPAVANSTAAQLPAVVKPVPKQLPAVVAKVAGEAIERWELESAVKEVEARAGGPVPPDKRDAVLRNVLDQLVAYHILVAESRSRKLEISDADVTARLAQLRSGFATEQAFKQALAAQGLSVERLQRQTRLSLQVAKIIETEINSKVSVQDREVGAFYLQNVERFKQGESVHASHILIAIPRNAAAAQKQQARAKAQQALKQVRDGADFAQIARARSQDPGSAAKGGDLGFFPRGQMEPSFEAAAFALTPGAVSAVIETPFGFHLIKVHERRQPHTATLDEVSGQIKELLTAQQREAKLNLFVEQAKTKTRIEILV